MPLRPLFRPLLACRSLDDVRCVLHAFAQAAEAGHSQAPNFLRPWGVIALWCYAWSYWFPW